MRSIKVMLVGIAIILLTILVRQCMEVLLLTDFIAILGVVFVIAGCLIPDK